METWQHVLLERFTLPKYFTSRHPGIYQNQLLSNVDIITEKQSLLFWWAEFLAHNTPWYQPIHHIQIQPFFCKFFGKPTLLFCTCSIAMLVDYLWVMTFTVNSEQKLNMILMVKIFQAYCVWWYFFLVTIRIFQICKKFFF